MKIKLSISFVFFTFIFLACFGVKIDKTDAGSAVLKSVIKSTIKSAKEKAKSIDRKVFEKLEKAKSIRDKKVSEKLMKKNLKKGSGDGLSAGVVSSSTLTRELFRCDRFDRGAIASENLNIRKEANLKSPRLGVIKKGTRVCVRKRSGDYRFTQFGWVSGRYLIDD